jgi:hypothetical protein
MMLDGRMFYFTSADIIRQLLEVFVKEFKGMKEIKERKKGGKE